MSFSENKSEEAPIRVQKLLANRGFGSRRKAEELIAAGRVTVNDEVAQLGCRVDPVLDRVCVDGSTISRKEPPKVYYMLHKPDKYLCSTTSENGHATIYDLPSVAKQPFRLVSVGRLDYRSEGLILLTNDGDLSFQVTHPRFKVEKQYFVIISGKLRTQQLEDFNRSGMKLDDGMVRAQISFVYGKTLGASKGACYLVSIAEGRNRVVRRIFEALDCKVVRLVRFGIGPLTMADDQKPGELRQLTSEQLSALKRATRGRRR